MKRIIHSLMVYRAKCNCCDCEFEYDRSEVKVHSLIRLLGFRKYVTCPQCGNKLWHSESAKTITEQVREETMTT